MSSMATELPQNEKLFTRIISKESSIDKPSLRVYYGGVTGSIPFKWESCPGTPKHTHSATSVPVPLTPPPSYYFKQPNKKNSRSNLLHTLFLKIGLNKRSNVSSPTTSTSSFSFSSSSWSSSNSSIKFHGQKRFSSPESSFRSSLEDEEDTALGTSSTSTWCCRIGRGRQGCFPV